MITAINKIKEYKEYAKQLVELSIPIILGNVGNMLIGVGDVIVAGRHSTITLAAISIATAIFMTFLIAGIGFIASISPVVSNLRGMRIPSKNLFRVTTIYSLLIGLLFFVLIRLITPLVPYMGLADNLSFYVVEYLEISSWGTFAGLLFVAFKEFLQAYEIVVFPNLIVVGAIFLNVFLNIVLVFGYLGFPELGVKGLAIASLIVRWLMAILLFIYCTPFLRGKTQKYKSYIKDLLKTGWPISLAMFFEFLGFNITAVLVGKFSAVYAACHNVIVTMTGTTYMIPLSISNAAAIKVGFANGEKNMFDIKKYTITGYIIIIGYMLTNMVMYGIFPKQLMRIFTKDPVVIQTCLPVFGIVLCFLLFDGLQCACVGALKGLKETKPIMWTMAFAYLIVSIPIGCLLAFKYNIVLNGFWAGLALGIIFACIISNSILIKKIKKLSKEYN